MIRIVVVAALGALAACADDTTTAPAAIELVPITHAEWERQRAAYAPDVVVVDMWATWCVPCIERFPKMVELNRRYADQGVRFVSLSLEDREDEAGLEYARQFLREQDARFTHFLLDEDILDGFDKLGILGIPAVDVYGRDGKLVERLTGDNPNAQFTDADVEAAILRWGRTNE